MAKVFSFCGPALSGLVFSMKVSDTLNVATSYSRQYGSGSVFEVTHNLDTEYPAVTVWDRGTLKIINDAVVETIDNNSVQVTVPYPIISFIRVIK